MSETPRFTVGYDEPDSTHSWPYIAKDGKRMDYDETVDILNAVDKYVKAYREAGEDASNDQRPSPLTICDLPDIRDIEEAME